MYKNILVPVLLEDSPAAHASFEVARTLADDAASFTVLHVIEPIPAYVLNQIPEDVLKTTRASTEQSLKDAAAHLPTATPVLITGHAGRSIVDYADAHDMDCIVIESHRPNIANMFIGSTADRVVRHAGCAVHVIR